MDAEYAAQERVVQSLVKPVFDALENSWSIDALISAWRSTAPSRIWTRQEITDWIRLHVPFNTEQLGKALATVWATGFILGKDLADFHVARAKETVESESISKADNSNAGSTGTPTINMPTSYDWTTWVAGNRAAAVLANPTGGLAARLSERNITLKNLTDTTVNRIGTVLANGLEDGLSPHVVAGEVAGELIDSRINWAETLEDRLKQIAQDQKRAETIARTEMNQAVTDEKLARYADFGITALRWVTRELGDWPCDDCAMNEGEVRQIGDPFPSDDTEPLVHPNCYCDLIPDLSEFRDDTEKALRPELKDAITPTEGIPSVIEVERALSRLEILPNPAHPELRKPEKFVESPWTIVPMPTVDPNIWDRATIQLISLEDLFGTDPWLKRKNVKKHIESMGQALLPYRSYAMIFENETGQIIIDGHHRLMALWLLGLDKAPVWLVKDN